MKIKISTKVAFGTFIIAGFGVIIFAFLSFNQVTDYFKQNLLNSLSAQLESDELEIKNAIKNVKDDITILSKEEAIKGIIRANKNEYHYDAHSNLTLENWKARLKRVFLGIFRQNSAYFKIRLIGVNNGGKEIISVSKRGDEIYFEKESELQQKAHRYYYKDTISLKKDEIYISKIDINRERGNIVFPIKPTIRFAIPLYDDNKIFGMIIINTNIHKLFGLNKTKHINGRELYLTNSNGYYLYHRDIDKTFGFEFGKDYKLKYKFKVDDIFSKDINKLAFYTKNKLAFNAKKIYLTKDKFIILASSSTNIFLQEQSSEYKKQMAIYIFIITILVTLASMLLTRYLTSPIVILTNKAKKLKINSDEYISFDGTKTNDEIGELSDSLESMLVNLINSKKEIAKFASSLEEQVDEQTKELRERQTKLEETNAEMEEQQQQLEEANAEMEEQQQQLEETNAQMEEQQQYLEEANAKMEEQQLQLTTTADKLNEKNQTLTKSQKELQASNEYKSEFLANMSHELRTPLNSIILLSKMLSKNKQEHLDEKEVKKIEVINHSGNELLRLINDILDLSKVEAGKMSLNLSEIDTTILLQQFQDMFEHTAIDKGLELIIKDELNTTFINDEDKLSQIIRNLLSNAFKFTKNGYIELGIIDSGEEDRPIQIYVKDSGIGIPEKKQKLIFEAFSQADGSTSREYGGTGLGLSITKEFAKLMKSYVKLESIENEGSTFSILLPKSAGKLSQKLIKERKPEYKIDKIVIDKIDKNEIIDDRENISVSDGVMLIIEDDINFIEILKHKINNINLKALIATSGNEGLELAKKYKVDGVLLDLGLPDMSGVEILRELKQDIKTKHIPVHIISAEDKDNLPQKLGAVGFIQKPAKEEDIDDAIKKLYETHNKKPKHILIVEDDKNQQDAMIGLIEDEESSIELKAVDSAKIAIEELKKGFYDIVIIDLGLSSGSGYEICDYMKKNNIETPIIIYTGRDLSEDEANKLRIYTDSIILKTANSDERLLEDIELFLHNIKTTTEKQIEKPKSLEVNLEGKYILVVDDDAKNIFVLSSALEEEGIDVIDAKNGKIALEILREEKNIDLVLMDIMMPVMNGYEAIAEIRKDKRLKHLPIIAATAKAMKDDKQKCIDVGADDYISKPLDLDLLIKMVKAWVNKSHS